VSPWYTRQDRDRDHDSVRVRAFVLRRSRDNSSPTYCADLIHFDLPWNPSRLEQRNGRIDRKLQPAKQVFCRYFHYEQREADIVLDALVRKTEVIQRIR
jgi:hypothetical protein